MQVLNSATLFICLTCVILALRNSPTNTKVHISFAAMMACIGLLSLELLFIDLEYHHISIEWFWVSGVATVAVPAWFYLYFSASLRLESQFHMRELVHFVPVFIYFAISIPYAFASLEQKMAITQAFLHKQPLDWPYQLTPFRGIRMGVVATLAALYLPLSWYELNSKLTNKKRDVLKELQPYKGIILVFAVIFVFSFSIFMIKLPFHHNWIISGMLLPIVTGFALLYWRLPQCGHTWKFEKMSEVALQHDNTPIEEPESLGSEITKKIDKKYRSSVNEHIAESTLDNLTALLDSGLYKDSTLTLRKLASSLGISQHHLSQIINENTEGNYYDLVNSYRLSEAKRLLSETEISVIDVAYESGFNSKSAFYSEFKKKTGLTPGQFRSENEKA